jgi:ribonuclease G
MSEEILVNITPPETRVAVVENGVVQEIIVERLERRGLVGNIYKGRICRVLPGMQAAFVDIGLERAAFLHTSDIVGSEGEPRGEHIHDLVSEGDTLVVQVVKDPLGTKGARLTTNISIPSRYLVFMPTLQNTGVSQKIEDEEERRRLRDILHRYVSDRRGEGGYIARTAADGITEEALINDMAFLSKLWHDVKESCRGGDGIGLVHEDLPLALRALRDLGDPRWSGCASTRALPWTRPCPSPISTSPTSATGWSIIRASAPSSISMGWRRRSRRLCSARCSSSPAVT